MKTFLKTIFILSTLFFLTSNVLAITYPSTCPAEAQAVVIAVGGCNNINSTQYSAIYSKCCSANTVQTQKTSKSVQTGSNNQSLIDTLSAKYPHPQETTPATLSVSYWIFSCVIFVICMLLILFWIWMITDVVRRNLSTPNKILWLLIVIFLSWFGALIYYFVVRRPMVKK